MKNWLKYLLLSLSLILLVGGKYLSGASSSNQQTHFVHNSSKKAENKNAFSGSNLDKISNTDEILIEIDEEDNFHSDEFSGLSFDNSVYAEVYRILCSHSLLKKITFNKVELVSLQNKIFILFRNLRI